MPLLDFEQPYLDGSKDECNRELEVILERLAQRRTLLKSKRRTIRRIDALINERRFKTTGAQRLKGIRDTIETFRRFDPSKNKMVKLKLSDDQEKMTKFFTQHSLPVIYGSEWAKRPLVVMKENNITKFMSDIGVVRAPRQVGKTTILSVYSAAVALNVPGQRIMIISIGKRASDNLLKSIRDMINNSISSNARRICYLSDGKIYISVKPLPLGKSIYSTCAKRMAALPTTTVIEAYPGNPEAVRGQWGHLILLEEIEFIDYRMMTESILPLLGDSGRVALGISTPGDDSNIVNTWLETKDVDGNARADLLDLGLACPACVDEGKAMECTHRKKTLPPWKSRKKLKRMGGLIPDQSVNAKENLGVAASSKNLLFKRKLVVAFFNRQVKVVDSVDVIFMGLDPAGGSDGSDFCIMSMVRTWHNDIIIGCGRTKSDDSQVVSDLIVSHTVDLLKCKYAENAMIVFIPESNMSFINAHAYATAIEKIVGKRRFFCMQHKSGRDGVKRVHRGERMGVWTGPTQKSMFVTKMKQSLELERLAFDPDGFGHGFKATMQELQEQLCRFHRKSSTKDGETPTPKSFKFRGKLPGGKTDDIALTGMIILYWSDIYRREQRVIENELGF